jgi:hypothetical protein
MSATEQNKDRTPHQGLENFIGVKPSDGDDRQLPGIGYRRDCPSLPSAEERPAQQATTSARGQAQFLLTGLGTLVPIAAFTVPTFRRRLLAALQDDAAEARLTGLAGGGGTIAAHLLSRTPSAQSRGRYRLSLLPSLLLGALLGGGATLLYFSRRNAGAEADLQPALHPRQQPRENSQQPSVPTISGAVKEAAVTMVHQAQEIRSEARSTNEEQSALASDEQPTPLTNAGTTEAQPANTVGEAIPVQTTLVTIAPSATTKQSDAALLTTATSNERPQAAVPTSPPSPTPAPVEEAATPSTASAAKREEKPIAAVPQREQVANEAPAATTELQARIKEHMPVLDSKGMRVGAVDRVEASGSIKLTKDGQGKHHWLPLRWVTRVDTHVHLARTAQQVRREWKTSAPRAH